MEMPKQWLGDAVQATMWDRHRQKLAPIAIWGAVRALADGEPSQILVDVLLQNRFTEWRVIWITQSALGLVTASKALEGWSAYTDDEDVEYDIGSWVRPLAEVSAVRLDAIDCRPRGRDEDRKWMWSLTATVEFRGGTHAQVPPGGEVLNDEHDAEVQAFLAAVVAGCR